MRAFTWLSDWLASLEPRERRIVLGGAAVSVVAVVLAWGVLPFLETWQQREAALTTKKERIARLSALVAAEGSIRARLEAGRRRARGDEAALLDGGTAALAASELQVLLRRYADASPARLSRVDVLAAADTTVAGFAAVPVRLTAESDVRGLTAFLRRIQEGRPLLRFDQLQVSGGRLLDDGRQVLTLSGRLHGYFRPEARGP